MKSMPIGRSALQASRLAYGCWRITGVSHPHEVTPEREARARDAILAAYDAGYTLFDLADVYCDGAVERVFGQALQAAPGMRDRIVIVSKCGIRRKGDPHEDSPYRYDSSADYLVAACERALKRLQIDTLDVLLIHRPDYLMHPEEIAGAFTRLQQAGKVREFGVSNFSVSQFALLQKACPMPLVANQIELSLTHFQPFQDGTLDQCQMERSTPMAWSPLGAGRLASNTPIELHDPTHARRLHVRETLDLVARVYGLPRAVVAIAWLLKHPAGIQPVIGATNPEHIRSLTAADSLDLSRDEWYSLMESALGHRLP